VAAIPIALIVDDDPRVREALQRLLEREGLDTVGAGNLAGARERIARHRDTLQVVIVDLGLGEEDGLDLVRELRRSDPPPSILVFSAVADGARGAQALALGVDRVLTKPASPDAIVDAVRRVLAGADPGVAGEWLRTHPPRGSHRAS
jgi:DNA-binding response OmpR family regulator